MYYTTIYILNEFVNKYFYLLLLLVCRQENCMLNKFILLIFLHPTKEEVHVFARVRLSVCLLARLLKNACMDLDEMLHIDRCRDMDKLINF